MKDACEIAVVLDRSGSMAECKDATIKGFNKFLAEQKAVPGECNLTLTQFDHEYEIVHEGVKLVEVPQLDNTTYVPRGTTALLDAIGRTIIWLGSRLEKQAEADRPNRVAFIILTDGLENASKEFTHQKVMDMIKEQQNKYDWKFVFLGANQDAIAVGSSIGAQGVNYTATDQGTQQMYSRMSCCLGGYRKTGYLDVERLQASLSNS